MAIVMLENRFSVICVKLEAHARAQCHQIKELCSSSPTSTSDPAGLSLHAGPFIRLLQSVTAHPVRGGHLPGLY